MSEKLNAFLREFAALKKMAFDGALNADLRNLLNYPDFELSVGALKSSKLNRRAMELVYEIELPKLVEVLPRVMGTIDMSLSHRERAGPNDFIPLRNGHFRTILMRYIAPGSIFCRGKKVLDVCCRRGWGSVLLSRYAAKVHGIVLDGELIEENHDYWKDFNIFWKEGSVLDAAHFDNDFYNTVIGMEMIEHFTRKEGKILFDHIFSAMKPSGYFLVSSAHPNTRSYADVHPALKTDGHKFLWSVPELKKLLEPRCESVSIIGNWMLVFQKKL